MAKEQPKITSHFSLPKSEKIQKYKTDSLKRKKLNEVLVGLIAKDMRPMSIVEDEGFKDFCTEMNPSYTLPSRKTLRTKLLPRLYNSSMIELVKELEAIKHVYLTTDGWTSSSADKYQVYTIHYVNWAKEDPIIESKILECSAFKESSTGIEIEKDLRRVTTKYGITDKVCLNVADNASDVQLALHLFGVPKIGCGAHKLNLCAKRVLKKVPVVKDLQAKVSEIVRTTKVSANAKKTLFECQKKMGFQKNKALVSYCETRWNTVYLMFMTALGKFS